MHTCAHCGVVKCRAGDTTNLPKNCPTNEAETMAACVGRYRDAETEKFFIAAAEIEAEGRGRWPRLREIGEFSRKMGYKKIGVAFCGGLKSEAAVVVDVLRAFGLEVESVMCKTGGVDKSEAGIPQTAYTRPGGFEPMCNPIAQAEFLNRAGTEFNVVVGLCVGHDSLFFKHSAAPATTLIAKDRALANNPAGAVYCAEGYMRKSIYPENGNA
jgi:uncharacterized metal-binding protein